MDTLTTTTPESNPDNDIILTKASDMSLKHASWRFEESYLGRLTISLRQAKRWTLTFMTVLLFVSFFNIIVIPAYASTAGHKLRMEHANSPCLVSPAYKYLPQVVRSFCYWASYTAFAIVASSLHVSSIGQPTSCKHVRPFFSGLFSVTIFQASTMNVISCIRSLSHEDDLFSHIIKFNILYF